MSHLRINHQFRLQFCPDTTFPTIITSEGVFYVSGGGKYSAQPVVISYIVESVI